MGGEGGGVVGGCVGCACIFLYVTSFLKALVYMILWFNYNVMDMENVMFYLVIISDTTNEFLPEDNTDLLN